MKHFISGDSLARVYPEQVNTGLHNFTVNYL